MLVMFWRSEMVKGKWCLHCVAKIDIVWWISYWVRPVRNLDLNIGRHCRIGCWHCCHNSHRHQNHNLHYYFHHHSNCLLAMQEQHSLHLKIWETTPLTRSEILLCLQQSSIYEKLSEPLIGYFYLPFAYIKNHASWLQVLFQYSGFAK